MNIEYTWYSYVFVEGKRYRSTGHAPRVPGCGGLPRYYEWSCKMHAVCSEVGTQRSSRWQTCHVSNVCTYHRLSVIYVRYKSWYLMSMQITPTCFKYVGVICMRCVPSKLHAYCKIIHIIVSFINTSAFVIFEYKEHQ